MKPAIVYLAQNTHKDPQYGRNSRVMLEKSLDLLFKNYNEQFKHDVLIFHEGDFLEKDQEQVACGRKEIKFKEIHFLVPDFLRQEEIPRVWPNGDFPGYGMGYRHMLRFFAVQIFDILHDLRYDWFMRLDDDSFIHSKINYDLFEFMERNNFEYGYRVDIREAYDVSQGFGETVAGYVRAENINSRSFEEHWEPTRLRIYLTNLVKAILIRKFRAKKYIMSPSSRYDLWGYYNNFFITKIAFWKTQEVQSFIHYFDRIGVWYKYRWGDALFQSAAIQIFMPKHKVFKFTDWTYEHATFEKGKLSWGGIYESSLDIDSEAVKQFRDAYGALHLPIGRSY